MITCPYCETQLTEEYYFCESCERQIKCRNCHALLLPNKSRCLICGNPLVSSDAFSQQMNQFSLEETQTPESYQRRVEVRATDSAIEKIAPLLGGQVSSARIITQPLHAARPRLQELPPTDGSSSDDSNINEESASSSEASQQPQSLVQGSDGINRALLFFERDIEGERLVPIQHDYKGKSGKEQQQRFILMYVWAYFYIFNKPVPVREDVREAAKVAGIYDHNFATYFAEVSKKYLISSSAGYRTNPPGNIMVNTIINDLSNESKSGFRYWENTPKAGTKRNGFNKEDEQSINEWIAAELHIGSVDVRNLRTSTNYAMFAIWAVTKGLGVVRAVKPKTAYVFLTRKYMTVSVKPKIFSDALNRSANSSLFARTADGLYYLTEKAEHQVEAWIKGSPIKIVDR